MKSILCLRHTRFSLRTRLSYAVMLGLLLTACGPAPDHQSDDAQTAASITTTAASQAVSKAVAQAASHTTPNAASQPVASSVAASSLTASMRAVPETPPTAAAVVKATALATDSKTSDVPALPDSVKPVVLTSDAPSGPGHEASMPASGCNQRECL